MQDVTSVIWTATFSETEATFVLFPAFSYVHSERPFIIKLLGWIKKEKEKKEIVSEVDYR